MVAVPCFASTAVAENLAPNPGFEQVEPNGSCTRWFEAGYSRANDEGTCRLVTDASQACRGSRFWELENRHKHKVKAIHCGSQHMAVKSSEEYVIRVRARGHGTLGLLAYGYSPGKFLLSIGSGKMTIDTEEWELRSMVFKPFRKGDTAARVRIDDGDWQENQFGRTAPDDMQSATPCLTVSSGKVAFDDVAVYRVGHEPIEKAEEFLESDRKPFMTIGKTDQPPAIDGKIGRGEWRRAGAVTGFVQIDDEKSERDTIVYACYDDEKLYFALDSSYDTGIGMGEALRDGKFGHKIDAIEVWILSPNGKWYQFLGMPSGGILDQREDARAWNGAWEFKNLVVDSGETAGGVLTFARGSWDAEISIPFEDLGASVPKPGEVWRMNFCRDYRAQERGPRDWTSWSPTTGRFANPKRFGYVRFGGPGPVLQVRSLGDLMDGGVVLAGEVSAAGPSTVVWQTRVQNGANTVVSEIREIRLKPNRPEELRWQQTLKVAGATDMVLQVSALDEAAGDPVYHTRIPFTVKPSFRMNVIPLHLKGVVDVEIDASRLSNLPRDFRVEASISPADRAEVLLKQDVSGMDAGDPKGKARFDTSSLKPGPYSLKAILTDAQGVALASCVEPLPVPDRPEWLGNAVGLTDEIPSPYRPIKTAGREVEIVERRYVVHDSGLPQSIVAAGEELLAEPLGLSVVVDGKQAPWHFEPLKQTSRKPGAVTWQLVGRAGPLSLKGRLLIEYDGFARWTVDLDGPSNTPVDLLAFTYALPRDRALYARAFCGKDPVLSYYAALFRQRTAGPKQQEVRMSDTWVFGPAGWQRPGDFFHTLWIGDDSRGLSLVCETDENVLGKRHTEIAPRGKDLAVTVHLISERTRLAGPLHYDYAWQATPLKPRPEDPKRWHICYGGGSHPKEGLLKRMHVGLDYHALKYVSYPVVRNPGWSKRRIQQFHKYGAKVVPADYLAAASKETEEWKLYGREWEIMPRGGWSHSIQGPAAYACPTTSHLDFLTYGFKKLCGDFGFDGLYLDVSGPTTCLNARHPCGYERDGKRQPSYNLFTWRELYKRLYTYLHTAGRDGMVFRHGMRPACIAAFVDAVTQGEEWCVERERQYRRLSPDMFRTKEMRTQFGTPYSWYTFHYYAYRAKRYGGPVPLNAILMMCLLHRVMPTIGNDEIWPVWDFMDNWWTASEFVPYWDDNTPAEATGQNVFASTYLKKGKEALIVVGNWNYEPADTTVAVDFGALGLEPSRVKTTEVLTQSDIEIAENAIRLQLKERDLKMLRVGGTN